MQGRQGQGKTDRQTVVALPHDAKCAISDGPVGLHLCRTRHLAGRVAVGLRNRSAAAGTAAQSCGVPGCPCRGGGSRQARRGAEARGGGSARRVDAEILGGRQLRARKQLPAHGLPACPVEGHLFRASRHGALAECAGGRLGAL